jgi:hypothetical protein
MLRRDDASANHPRSFLGLGPFPSEGFISAFHGRAESPLDIPTATELQTISRTPPTDPRAHAIWCTLRANPAAWLATGHYWDSIYKEDPWDPNVDPTVSSQPLVYRPLSNADAEIRLLTLQPNEPPDQNAGPIRCTLERVSLLDAPEYVALSYRWGDDNETRSIVVDGHRISAFTNLHQALRRLRADGKTKIWIDAVCINQHDREEQSQQIQRMRSIYARAKQVIVWLGPETSNSNLAMWLLKKLSKPHDDLQPDQAYTEAMKERSSTAPPGRFAEAWTAFDDLFAQEYWKRVWIIQEIAASRDILVCCGQESITWPDLETAFWGKKQIFDMFNKRTDADSTMHPRNTHQLFDFWAWKRAIASAEPQPLLKALVDSRRSKATNPRDHVYALFGICSDSSTLIPVPNYKLSVEQVFIDLATAMIRANGNLDIICLQSQTGAKKYGTPSWVPDWSALAEVERPWLLKSVLNNNGKTIDDLATVLGTVVTSYKMHIRGNILCVSGRLFGTVDGLSTGISYASEIVGEIAQPTVETTAYKSGYAHAAALNDALMLVVSSDSPQTRGKGDLIHYLTHPKGKEVMSTYEHTQLATWLDANRSFKICGIELYLWTRMHFGSRWQWKKRLSHHFEDKASFAQDIHKYMSDIETVLKGGMRLMTTNRGYIGMAHSKARAGDHICLLEGMSTPVILRPCSDQELGPDAVIQQQEVQEMKESRYMSGMTFPLSFQSYKVVGEAFVRMGDGPINVQLTPLPFRTFFIH